MRKIVLGGMWEETVLAYFKILHQHSSNRTEENQGLVNAGPGFKPDTYWMCVRSLFQSTWQVGFHWLVSCWPTVLQRYQSNEWGSYHIPWKLWKLYSWNNSHIISKPHHFQISKAPIIWNSHDWPCSVD